jgi:hypothetical protein
MAPLILHLPWFVVEDSERRVFVTGDLHHHPVLAEFGFLQRTEVSYLSAALPPGASPGWAQPALTISARALDQRVSEDGVGGSPVASLPLRRGQCADIAARPGAALLAV